MPHDDAGRIQIKNTEYRIQNTGRHEPRTMRQHDLDELRRGVSRAGRKWSVFLGCAHVDTKHEDYYFDTMFKVAEAV